MRLLDALPFRALTMASPPLLYIIPYLVNTFINNYTTKYLFVKRQTKIYGKLLYLSHSFSLSLAHLDIYLGLFLLLCLLAQIRQKLGISFCLPQALQDPLGNLNDIIRIGADHSYHAPQQVYLF